MERGIFKGALILAAICNCICSVNCATSRNTREIEYEVGNPRACEVTEDTNILEVLPGGGWDNLQNVAMGQVLAFEYKSCKTTEDGKYLLPDFAFVIPQKYSRVDLFSEMFEKWNTYTSATARSINLEASFPNVVSGSFSTDYQNNKEHQINEQSITTRVQVRHLMYTVKTQPDARLDPAFKNRLLHIAANLQNNNTEIAWYQTQLLVRDFGTHYSTSVDAGAALVQEDHIQSKFVKDSKLTSTEIKAAASGVLYSKLQFSVGVQNTVSKGTIKEYQTNQTSSRIYTYGGPPFRADFTAADWQENLKDNLVSIDRNGDPLHFIVNSVTLPELPEPTVRRMATMVEQAIALYYKINTFPGCIDSKSLNFNSMANVADGSCDIPSINFTLGGIYQTCKSYNMSAGNLCDDLDQKNPLTGDYSCPEGYHSVSLLKRAAAAKSYLKKKCYKVCRWCGFLFLGRCCRKVCVNKLYYSNAEYDTYWCAADPDTMNPPRSGLMFGGLYTDVSDNPLTGAQRCPNRFYPVPLGGHAQVCISDDYEMGFKSSVQFAGFFSCSAGNPLAIGQSTGASRKKRDSSVFEYETRVDSFMARQGHGHGYQGPKECPQGYTIHLVIVDNECQINYCVKTGAFQEKMSTFKRPPFNPRPAVNPESTEAMAVVGVNGKVWYKNTSTNTWVLDPYADEGTLYQVKEDDKEEETTISVGATAAISIVTSFFIGAVGLGALFVYRRRKKRLRRRPRNSDNENICYNGPGIEEEEAIQMRPQNSNNACYNGPVFEEEEAIQTSPTPISKRVGVVKLPA